MAKTPARRIMNPSPVMPDMPESVTHEIRPISNGFIHRMSTTKPNGVYKTTETYHQKKPAIPTVSVAMAKPVVPKRPTTRKK